MVFFTPTVPAIVGLLTVGGVAWSPVNVNSLPMVVDASPSETSLGTYTGPWYVAGTLAAVVGPILNGSVIDLTGNNYNMIFLVRPRFFILAVLCTLGVTSGEAKAVKGGQGERGVQARLGPRDGILRPERASDRE